jgi:hypothetical protein
MRRTPFNRRVFLLEFEMKKQLATIVVLASIGLAAHAGGNNNGPVFGNVTNNTTNNAGGAGGNAAASAVAGGGNASNRTDVSTDVRNTNVNSAAQHQGQTQGQQQAAVAGSSSGGNTLSTTITEAANTVSSAVAPSMNPTANCAIPVTGGVTAATWSISGGSAYESDTCVTIEQAKMADSRGERAVAGEILCGLPKYRAARKATGTPCGADKTAAAPASAPTVAASSEPTDPYIRRRLGLAPL